jgi:hypothetical protein
VVDELAGKSQPFREPQVVLVGDHPVDDITTGSGGMALRRLASSVRRLGDLPIECSRLPRGGRQRGSECAESADLAIWHTYGTL